LWEIHEIAAEAQAAAPSAARAGAGAAAPAVIERAAALYNGAARVETPARAASARGEAAAQSAADFGTLVHALIEDRFKGRSPLELLNGRLGKAARLAGRFFDSPLGKMSLAAPFRKTEYGFVLRSGGEDGDDQYISGKIDLLFKSEDALYIVDYKTDRKEEPAMHAAQLRVYRDAAAALFPEKGPVRAFLFYLRTGRAVALEDAAP
jgi:ATP-dependent exoDNAse (exonuclease V) beta subunit